MITYQLIRSIQKRGVARKMYLHLKERLRSDPVIQIDKEQLSLQRFGKVDREMWSLVDKMRVDEGEIGYYEDDNLYWRRL